MSDDEQTTPLVPGDQGEVMRHLSAEQIERGLHPQTLDDLQYRAAAFSQIDPKMVIVPKKKQW